MQISELEMTQGYEVHFSTGQPGPHKETLFLQQQQQKKRQQNRILVAADE